MPAASAGGETDAPAGSPAVDPQAPYARLAVVGLVCRAGQYGGHDEHPAERCPAKECRWLLLHRTQPFDAWDPPGGRMETGEDLARAVVREVWEETGLTVEVGGPCYAFLTFYKGERLLAVSMACRPSGRASGDPDALRLEPDGAEEWRWATAEEWETLAGAGLSSWDPLDVKKATRAVVAVWEAEQG